MEGTPETERPMRPDILNPLFRDVTSLAGVGPKVGEAIGRLLGTDEGAGLPRVVDLLFHLPTAIVDRRNQPGVARSPEGAIVTLELRIDRHVPPPPGNRKQPYRVFADDDSGEIALVFFHADSRHLAQTLPIGAYRLIAYRPLVDLALFFIVLGALVLLFASDAPLP